MPKSHTKNENTVDMAQCNYSVPLFEMGLGEIFKSPPPLFKGRSECFQINNDRATY